MTGVSDGNVRRHRCMTNNCEHVFQTECDDALLEAFGDLDVTAEDMAERDADTRRIFSYLCVEVVKSHIVGLQCEVRGL